MNATDTAGAILAKDLRSLGLTAKDGVFVHASLRAIGPIQGRADTMVQALLDAVGPQGLVAMPGFSTDAYPPLPIWIIPPLQQNRLPTLSTK